ncbi:hypothetical protein [Streptomyces mesophilus]|uniref:hypothetical protein n=1 Tax=Streptomyces mesophilus TaxID=1775132 RepID=UPI00332217B4
MPIDPHRALTAYLRAQSYTVPPQRPRRPAPEIREDYPGAAPAAAPPTTERAEAAPVRRAPAQAPAPTAPARAPGLVVRVLRLCRRGLALR